MSALHEIAHALRALNGQRRDNLREYPSVPAADDRELRERLRQERADEPRYRSWEDIAADDAGQPRCGEL